MQDRVRRRPSASPLTAAAVAAIAAMATAALAAVLFGAEGSTAERACNACGPECSGVCGTAMFRACCFNFNRKRSALVSAPPATGRQQSAASAQLAPPAGVMESRRTSVGKSALLSSSAQTGAGEDLVATIYDSPLLFPSNAAAASSHGSGYSIPLTVGALLRPAALLRLKMKPMIAADADDY